MATKAHPRFINQSVTADVKNALTMSGFNLSDTDSAESEAS